MKWKKLEERVRLVDNDGKYLEKKMLEAIIDTRLSFSKAVHTTYKCSYEKEAGGQ
jgi:hypothetical protein